jgi:hypothetical protein
MAELPEDPGTNPTPEPLSASPAPPPFQPVATSYQPISGQPQAAIAPAKSGGSSAIKIVLIVVAIFVVLGILGAGIVGYGIWRVSRSIHSSISSAEKTITTPGGSFTVNSTKTFTSDDLGIALYPGAEQITKGSMRMTLPTGPIVAASFLTSDSKDKVIAFYKDKLGSEATTMDAGDTAILSANKSKEESVMLTITQKPSENNGKTHIHIVHTVNNKAT